MKSIMTLTVWLLLGAGALAQESNRKIEGAGAFTKHLTPGQLDTWTLEGKAGETLIAHVSTREFDPVLELATPGGKEDKVLFAVDDKGSESRFAFRLPAAGTYKIRVHGFKYRGGGNYSLRVRRFQASPLKVGGVLVGTLDRDGRGHHWFAVKRGQVLCVRLTGAPTRGWEMLDPKGRKAEGWAGTVMVADDGEHSLAITGGAGARYEVSIREARQVALPGEGALAKVMEPGVMDVVSFEGKPGDFRVVHLQRSGQVNARLIFAPKEKADADKSPLDGAGPEVVFLPVASKGQHIRLAALLRCAGRYQLQLAAGSEADYVLTLGDPTKAIPPGEDRAGKLALGAAEFYSFRAQPGQLITAGLESGQFDPVLNLYDDHGRLIARNDDGDGGVGSRLTHMATRAGTYRLRVASLGDGGGGEYTLSLREQKLMALQINGRGKGTLEFGATDFWSFLGKEGQVILLSARSAACNPALSLYSPDGVRLATDDNSGVGTDSLMAVKLPRTGRYTVWIRAASGAGEYSVRLIDGE